MILEGNARGGARNLAQHLLKEENDHVTVHEVRGFMSDELEPALDEIYAVSRGTKAKKYMFSLSLNPPPQAKVSTEDFEKAIQSTEKELGFENQPRAIVFHEKNARRHCHVVWSRIDSAEMKAIPVPYYKRRLMDVSRDLYVQHGWQMPKGMMQSSERNPTNFTLKEWQQAKRSGKDPRETKTVFQDCWAVSDSLPAFKQALKERGYTLASGERGYVAVDHKCEVYSVARQLPKGINTKQVKAKLGAPQDLPRVDDAKTQIAANMAARLQTLSQEQQTTFNVRLKEIEKKRIALVKAQKQARAQLDQSHEQRCVRETRERQTRYNKGLRGFLDRITGKHQTIKNQNEQDAQQANKRDQGEKDKLIFNHMADRRTLTSRSERLESFAQNRKQSMSNDIDQYREVMNRKREKVDFRKLRPSRAPTREV